METSEQLMAEMAWVRRLARALVRDPAAAEDVAQETWIIAAEKAPDADRPLRPWLARVVVNLARTRRRVGVRREVREQAADLGRAVPSPQELVERVELQRIVAGEVLALAEPYRSTVLLHFVEGYTNAEIARRLGIPPGTVRRRLKTALDQLRAALRARPDQPSKGWLAALAPLATPPSTIGVIAMKKLVIALAIALLLLVAAFAVFSHRGGGRAGAPASAQLSHAGSAMPRGGRAPAFPPWLAQTGAPDRRIAGQVIAGGAPLAQATVRLGLVVDGAPGQLVAETRSAADGTFDFGLEPAAVFVVSAAAAGHSPAAAIVDGGDPTAHPDHVRLELGDCRSHLFGTVSDASGGPIAKARLSVAGLSGGETDGAGRYSICLPPDPPTLRIDADGYGSVDEVIAGTIPLATMTGELHRDFVLVPEAVLAGKVVDSTGRPIAGARVIARPAVAEGPRHIGAGWADSDGDGAFRITGLAPAQFDLTASANGFASATPVPAVARAATTSSEIRVVLASVARVRGQVVQGDTPVAGAVVVATTASGLASRKSTSQPDGTFVLDGVPLATVALTAAPYEVRAPKLLAIDRTEVDHVKLEVAVLTRVHGHVTRAGRPIAGAHVATDDHGHMTTTDATGAYTLDGLGAGVALISAWDTREKAFSETKHVVLAQGDDPEVELELDSSGEIQGVVVDEVGHPVAGAYVEFHLTNGGMDICEGTSDVEGKFDCPLLLGGDYAPRVQPGPGTRQGFAPASGRFPSVHVGPRDVVTGVRLAIKNERLAIRGTVVGDGGPVADVRVEAIGHGMGGPDSTSVMASVDGTFEIHDLPPGTYTVHAHASDGSDGVLPAVAAGGDPVTIKLVRAGSIVGTLAGFTAPPTVVATMAGPPGEEREARAIVDGQTFSITGLSPGRYAVEASAGVELDGAVVDVKSGETAHVALESRAVGRFEGTLYEFGTTTPVDAARCLATVSMPEQARIWSDAAAQTFTDPAGHFALSAPVGHVLVLCLPADQPLTPGGGAFDISTSDVAHGTLYSVRPTFGAGGGSVGLRLARVTLPVTVESVDPHGPAAAAGIQVGDHVASIDGGSLDGVLPVGAWVLILNHAPGATATLGIERGGSVRQVTLQVGDDPR